MHHQVAHFGNIRRCHPLSQAKIYFHTKLTSKRVHSRRLQTQGYMYLLPTALLNEHAHVACFWPVLPVIPCPFARLPCLLRQKLKKNKLKQSVARVVANAA